MLKKVYTKLANRNSFGGMSQVIVGQPLDTIKVRLQLDQGRFKGAWDCTVQTVQKEGFFALYKGRVLDLDL